MFTALAFGVVVEGALVVEGTVFVVVVGAVALADVVAQVVPLHACYLARLATDALGNIDQLGHLHHVVAYLRCRQCRCGTGNDIL